MKLSKTFRFEAAHWLPMVPKVHKCHNMHGHSYKVTLVVEGEIAGNGFCSAVDYAHIKEWWLPIFNQLDHQVLNEVDGLDNPTAENIARWIHARTPDDIVSVLVSETEDTEVVYP